MTPSEVPQPITAGPAVDAARGPAQIVPRPRQGIALCLSGGGYRAAIFHVGAIRRLNELGALAKIDAISCVSGGSILGGYLASVLRRGLKIENHRFVGLDEALDQFLNFTRRDIRTLPTLARLRFWEPPGRASRRLSRFYEELVGNLPLSQLPEHPRFIFCATNLFFANSWICERTRVGDYMSGYVSAAKSGWTLGWAMAVSSCFPPVFDPAPAGLAPNFYGKSLAPEADQPEQTADEPSNLDLARSRTTLTDGGVYDNLGLEPVWKRYATVLVSDGGKPLQHRYVPPGLRLMRYPEVIQNQVLALRKRWLLDIYQRAKSGTAVDTFNGTYWGIMSSTSRYRKNPGYGYSKGLASKIANIRTDMNWFSPNEIAVLQIHGYQLADIAIQTHAKDLAEHADAPLALPYASDRLLDENLVDRALAWSESRFWSTFTASRRDLLDGDH